MGKQVQFVVLLIKAFIGRHKKEIGVGFLAGFFATLFLIQVYPVYLEIFGQRELKIAYVGRVNELNLPLTIKNKISLGLTELLPEGVATPSLARGWKIDNNGLNYTFSLLPNIYWQDSTKFTAKDVSYKLKGVNFAPLDDYTLKVTLKDPYAPLPVILSQPLLKPNLIGLGLYKVTKVFYNGELISELRLEPLKKGLQPIIYKFYPSIDDAILAFKLGEVNMLENISTLEDLADWKNIKKTEGVLYDRLVGVFLNLRNPSFKEKEVRQALNYALPAFGGLEKAYSPISPLSWAYSKNLRLYRSDPEAAKKILDKSPLASSSSELTISTYASLLDTAQLISDAWKRVGVNSKVKVESAMPADYQVMVMTFIIPPDPDQYQFWQSTQEGTNLTHYSNLKVDKLLEDGRKTQDQDKRVKIYADFQRYLVDDSPVLFLYHPKVYTVERK